MAISHKPGTVFNSPETQQWAVHGQPTCPTSVPPFAIEFLTYFLSYKHQSIIYSINYHKTPQFSPQNRGSGLSTGSPLILHRFQFLKPISIAIPGLIHTNIEFKAKILELRTQTAPKAATAAPWLKSFVTIRSQALGPIKRPLTASKQPKHGKTLKNGNKTQVGRKSYLLELSKTRKPRVHA